jgi:hypothetical protein
MTGDRCPADGLNPVPRPSVAVLWHFRIGPHEEWDDDGSERLVGVYSNVERATAAAARLRILPGFSDWPDGFRIFECWLDHDSWTEGYAPWDAT